MTLDAFISSLSQAAPPAELNGSLQALWWDGKGNWEQAHTVAQDINTSAGSWIHAYLHRKEGDRSNAAYWYARAGKNMPHNTLDEEWQEIVAALL
jgi:hypothetical protein